METHKGNLNLALKILSICAILVFGFSLLSGVWSFTGWFLEGKTWGRCFAGLKEEGKDLGRNKLTLLPSYPAGAWFVWGTSLFSFAGQSLICCQPLALLTWSDGPESPVPHRGESAHVMGRPKGILLESNDLLAHACLGRLCSWHIAWHMGVLHHAEMHGKPLLSLSTNSVHFPLNCFLL